MVFNQMNVVQELLKQHLHLTAQLDAAVEAELAAAPTPHRANPLSPNS